MHSEESANAKEFARISQLQLEYEEGILKLSAPGKDPLAIDPADLKPTKEKEISLKLYDVHVQVMLVRKPFHVKSPGKNRDFFSH